jgi:large subunit ribosomal protein L17
MPHNVFGQKLSRDTGQRQALLKGLAGALIRSEAIETTAAKATAAKILIEKLITKARRGTLADVRDVEAVIVDKDLVSKLVHDIAPRFKGRPGGFLRLIKLGNRTGDNAPMVRMEFVAAGSPVVVEKEVKEEKPVAVKKPVATKKSTPKKTTSKKVASKK